MKPCTLCFLAMVFLPVLYAMMEQHTALGYFDKIGIPEAEKLYEQENSQTLMPRIVGGENADITDFKYQAGLIIQLVNFTGFAICGGSLISNNRVATAAHCWFDGVHRGKSMTVVLGSSKMFSGGTRVNTSEVYVHPEWDPETAANDVAVICLAIPVTFSETIAPIALPKKCEQRDYVGETAIASGFGRTGQNISINSDQKLSKVNLTVISNEVCSVTYPQIIQPSNICTSGNGTRGHVAICSGDSGGPLAITKCGKTILIGISSFGSPLGCDSNLPNGYSRVVCFIRFFKKFITT